jgi:nicotinamidase-related amidase
MALTQIDPMTALVVIDLQKGVVGLPTAHPLGPIIGRAASLAHAFRKRRLPVVLVNATGMAPGRTDAGFPKFAFPPDWTELIPELEAQPGDCRISKQRWGAFLDTSLDDYLRQRGVSQIVLVGVATSFGVESTARSAYDLGYNVVLVVDAMTDLSVDTHRNSIETIFPRLGETASTEDVLKLLNPEG